MAAPLQHLAWDTEHFGFPVAQIGTSDLDDAALTGILGVARKEGMRLVYWFAPGSRQVGDAILGEFAGILAARNVTYRVELSGRPDGPDTDANKAGVEEYPTDPATGRLVDLALTAGAFSRFKLDPRFPPEKFRDLYATWVERSARREIADVVLVAGQTPREPVGLITVSETAGAGRIGLVAVYPGEQGKGVGTRLVAAAHRWLRGRGATRCTVTTQAANVAACHLYGRHGYGAAEVRNVYHFWPGDRV